VKTVAILLAVITWSIFMFTSGTLWQNIYQYQDPMSCEEASAEVMGMQACLAHRPQCLIPNGPEQFKVYHEARRIEIACEEVSE